MTLFLLIVASVGAVFLVTVLFGAPYVPSQRRYVEDAFTELYPLGSNDVVVDVGSGDGRVLRVASRHGARAIGYEINPFLVIVSWVLCFGDKKITTHFENFLRTPFPSSTTLIYIFSESRDINRIAERIQHEATRLKRPLYVMSLAFELRDYVPLRRTKSHILYKIEPLHLKKAQV